MPEGQPLELDKQPMGGPVNQPASGTYGEKSALSNLQAALPQAPAGAGGPQGPPPPGMSPEPVSPLPPQREGRPGTAAALPPGVPSAIVSPTSQPSVPVSTPLSGPVAGPPQAMTGAQRRLQILDAMADSPDVSPETRDWAKMVRRVIVGA